MRRHPLIAALVLAPALGLVAGASAAHETSVTPGPFKVARGESVRSLGLTASRVASKRIGSTIRLRLGNVGSHVAMVTSKTPKGRNVNAVRVLPRYWASVVGFRPTVSVGYAIDGTRRTHVLTGGTLPRYVAGGKYFDIQFRATPRNAAVLARMRQSGASDVHVTLLPTPAAPRPQALGKFDPKVAQSKAETATSSSTTAVSPYSQPAPNTAFTLAYTPEMGGGSAPWSNYLTATGETTAPCQSYSAPSGVGGNVSTTGAIYVYQTAAEVQQALSVGASVGYKHGLAKASVSASYSEQGTESTSSLYAVAIVNYAGGVVSLGTPSLTGSYASQAAGITSISDALGFMNTCGDAYPVSYGAGATWVSVLQIKNSSQTESQQVSVKMKESYAGVGASEGFSTDLSSATSSASITTNDECWGTSACTNVPGYTTITTTDEATALTQFSDNYSDMLTGLPNECAPTANSFACITTVKYQPMSNLMSSSPSAAQSMQKASYGAFGVDQNLNAWNSEYQALVSGNPMASASDLSAWGTASANLTNQALGCSLTNLTQSACSKVFTSCWQASQNTYSYLDAQCEPSAFTTNSLSGLSDPFEIAGVPEANLAS